MAKPSEPGRPEQASPRGGSEAAGAPGQKPGSDPKSEAEFSAPEFSKARTLAQAEIGLGCLGKSELDEPVFVLCGRDQIALGILEQYARALEQAGSYEGNRFVPAVPRDKARGARRAYDAFVAWQGKHGGKVPD
jgi:hypothetical protein